MQTLLSGLEELHWPETVKQLQRRWLGKKNLVEFEFHLKVTTNKFHFVRI